jgi:hypothetical protein
MRSFRPVAAAPEVELRHHAPPLWAQILISAAMLGILLGGLLSLLWKPGTYSDYEYRLWRWEANTLPATLFGFVGIGSEPGEAEKEDVIRRYYSLTSQVRAELESGQLDTVRLSSLQDDRAELENDVEQIIAGFIDDAVRSAGLRESLPLFGDVQITWPPVSFELTNPPQVLVRSPRDRIERLGDRLLKEDLTPADINEIESRGDNEEMVSLVVSIGGIAAYPAIIRSDRNYWSTIDTASHEWVHHYLSFYPLGQQWGRSSDANTLNETTANIAGREFATIIREQNPVSFEGVEDGSYFSTVERTVDFNLEMRKLRLEVDRLLEEGKVEEAEDLMEETRLFLAENGVFIRKINQAYFAFYGTYADTPQSSDPIGPKVERVWELTGDVGTFLKVMRDVTTVADLDKTLARLEVLVGGDDGRGDTVPASP